MLESIKKYFRLLTKKEKSNFSLLLFFMLIAAVYELLAVLIIPAYIKVISNEPIVEGWDALNAYDEILGSSQNNRILNGGLIVFGVYLIKMVLTGLNQLFQERFIRGREIRFSADLFRKYLSADMIFHSYRNSSELIRNLQIEITTMNHGFIVPFVKAISQSLVLPLLLIALFYNNFLITLIAFVIMGVAVFVYNSIPRKKLVKISSDLQEIREDQLKVISQGIGGIKELKVMNTGGYFLREYDKLMQRYRNSTIFYQMVARMNGPYLEIVAFAGIFSTAIFLTYQGADVETLVSTIAFFSVAMLRLKQSLTVLMTSYSLVKVNHVTVTPVYKDFTELTADAPMAEQVTAMPFESDIKLDKLSFRFPEKDWLFKKLDLSISKNQSVGIVGTTGSGKTTMVDLILGLLDPEEGRILIDGQPVTDMAAWQKNLAYIPQNIFLMDDTIKANVAFGQNKEDIDVKRVWKALEIAQIADFVRELPDGIDTLTGERGARISGGQRQRIGIARAIYREASVLIMDEATSALDSETEHEFTKALESLRKGYTLLIIAHRISTIQNCDRIIVLNKGKVEASGVYNDLIETSKTFKRLNQIKQ